MAEKKTATKKPATKKAATKRKAAPKESPGVPTQMSAQDRTQGGSHGVQTQTQRVAKRRHDSHYG